jgi:hypothetical protein
VLLGRPEMRLASPAAAESLRVKDNMSVGGGGP